MATSRELQRARTFTIVALVVWFVAALVGGMRDIFFEPGRPPLALLAFILVPITTFITAYLTSAAFRAFTDELALTPIVAAHLWRFVGIFFVIGWLTGKLPAQFAIPAGFADIIAALGATLLIPGLRNGTASRSWVLAWNVFGLLDLLMAITLGALYSPSMQNAVGVTTRPMITFPVNLIPTFFVPAFILLHLLTFKKIAQMPARSERVSRHPAAVPAGR